MDEFTVFISVKIDSINEFSKLIPLKHNKDIKIINDKIKIIIVKKYLFISLKSKFIFVNISLFVKTFFGLLNDKIWFNEYLNSEYIFINLRPELVEKNDPPIITNKRKTNVRFDCSKLNENPIFEILLDKDNRLIVKLSLKLKNRKKIETTKM